MKKNETLLNNRFRCTFSEQSLLGSGQFGEVYSGTDTQTNAKIAIKQINKKELFEEDEYDGNYYRRAFEKELEILKLIKCKYSIELIDNFELGEYTYLILELCDTD